MSFYKLPIVQLNTNLIGIIDPSFVGTNVVVDTNVVDTNAVVDTNTVDMAVDTNTVDTTIINKSLYRYLSIVKEQIDTQQNEWDKYKKYTNSYEYIHTPIPNTKASVCNYKPLSRSFYKMIEICKSFTILEELPPVCKTFHLAEGPGGFIEALAMLRSQLKDTYYGMTLIDDDCNVPGWRKSKSFLLHNPNVTIEKGCDNRGDLMNPENLKYCYMKYNGSMNLITADGGFDFSMDFNKQESISSNLILAQIAFAIAMQKQGGTFIIKFFDTFTKLSLDMLFVLSNLYECVYFIKPHTSRIANSEKYVVCKGFRLSSSEEIVRKFYKIISLMSSGKQLISLFNFDLPYIFINKIEEINAIFGQQQIENIVATLNLINSTNNNKTDKLETMKKTNILKCVSWCQKYNLGYNKIIPTTNIFHSANTFGKSMANTFEKSMTNTFEKSITNTFEKSIANTFGKSMANTFEKSMTKVLNNTFEKSMTNTFEKSMTKVLAKV